MSASVTVPDAPIGDVPRRLVRRLREALVPVLTEGSWEQIEDDHKKVGLAWLLAPEYY